MGLWTCCLRETIAASDDAILRCSRCDRRFGHPSSGLEKGASCPFCKEGKLKKDRTVTVRQVFQPKDSGLTV